MFKSYPTMRAQLLNSYNYCIIIKRVSQKRKEVNSYVPNLVFCSDFPGSSMRHRGRDFLSHIHVQLEPWFLAREPKARTRLKRVVSAQPRSFSSGWQRMVRACFLGADGYYASRRPQTNQWLLLFGQKRTIVQKEKILRRIMKQKMTAKNWQSFLLSIRFFFGSPVVERKTFTTGQTIRYWG